MAEDFELKHLFVLFSTLLFIKSFFFLTLFRDKMSISSVSLNCIIAYIFGSRGVVQLDGLHQSCDGGPTKV